MAVFSDLPRPRRRLTELMVKTATDLPVGKDKLQWDAASKEWTLKFLRSPKEFLPDSSGSRVGGVRLTVNRLESPSSSESGLVRIITLAAIR